MPSTIEFSVDNNDVSLLLVMIEVLVVVEDFSWNPGIITCELMIEVMGGEVTLAAEVIILDGDDNNGLLLVMMEEALSPLEEESSI